MAGDRSEVLSGQAVVLNDPGIALDGEGYSQAEADDVVAEICKDGAIDVTIAI